MKRHNLITSFSMAIKGLINIFKTQNNARIIFICGVIAVILGVYLKISETEMLVLILTVGLVFVAEIFNTMVEETLDLITKEYNDKVKLIKDIAAGAVLMASLISLVVGYFIFIRRLLGIV